MLWGKRKKKNIYIYKVYIFKCWHFHHPFLMLQNEHWKEKTQKPSHCLFCYDSLSHIPFLSLPFHQDHFPVLCSLHVHPCKGGHEHLRLYLIPGSNMRAVSFFFFFFFNQMMLAKAARQSGPEWEVREITLSLITWKPRYWCSHWLRWMNLIYLPFWSIDDLPGAAPCLSTTGGLHFFIFFPCSAHKIPECAGGHLKESWQRLICFVPWRDSCISLSI